MSKSVSVTAVSPKTVRAAYAAGGFEAPEAARASLVGNTDKGARGRLHPEAVKAFEAANPGFVVAEKTVSNEATVTIVPTRVDAKGRTRTLKAREVTISEARRLGGGPARGRLSKATLAKAAAALGQK